MDEIERYNKIYTRHPEKWANNFVRNWLAYTAIYRYISEPETLIDIGCGNGHTIEFFNSRWPDTVYYGIDFSDVAIGLAKEKVPDAEFYAGDFKDFSVSCDVVTVMGVAEHFEKLVDGLRSLKDYGDLIYLEVPDCLSMGILNGSKNKNEGFRKTFKGGLQVEWHLKRSSWEERIRLAGLEIVEYFPGSDLFEFVWILK
jgi:SAM-dependent methyltransferase